MSIRYIKNEKIIEKINSYCNLLELIPSNEATEIIIKLGKNEISNESHVIAQLIEYFNDNIQHLGSPEMKKDFLATISEDIDAFVNGAQKVKIIKQKASR